MNNDSSSDLRRLSGQAEGAAPEPRLSALAPDAGAARGVSSPGIQDDTRIAASAVGNFSQPVTQYDRVYLLAQRLEQAGVALDQHWHEALPELPVRVVHVLQAQDCPTLARILLLLREDSAALMRLKNFGRKSLLDLWQALEKLAAGKTRCQPGLFVAPRATAGAQGDLVMVSPLPAPAELLLERLSKAGIDLDQPWQVELVELPVRLRNALNERFTTLREVVRAIANDSQALLQVKNLGRDSLRQLREAIEELARHGAGYHRYGAGGAPPASVAELLARALEALPDDEGRLLIRRCLDGLTLEQLGAEYSLTRERIRQKVDKTLERLALRFGAAAHDLTRALAVAGARAGGLLYSDMVQALTGEANLCRARLALLIAGSASVRVWRTDFLTTLTSDELRLRLSAIRRGFIKNRRRDLDLTAAGEIVRQAAGFDLDVAGLTCLLNKHFACQISADGAVLSGVLRVPDRAARILRAANRPLHIAEIAAAWLVTYAADEALNAFTNDEANEVEEDADRSATPPDSATRREAIEHSLTGALYRHDDIYQCDPRTFVHADALPMPLEKLDELAELCGSRIEGETGAVSTEYLLKVLEAAGLSAPSLNKYLLKDVLARRPEIISLKKLRVGHAASFQEHGFTLVDRVEAILRTAERPLSSDEIIQRLPRSIEYFPGGIVLCLSRAPFAVNLGGRYRHIESLGLSQQQRARLVEAALAHLPADGAPISCAALLQQMRAVTQEIGLADRQEAMEVLRGLLRMNEQVQCGAGYLVARRTKERAQPLLGEVVLQIVRDLILAYPRDVRRELANSYGERQSDSSVSSGLVDGVRRRVLRRLPASLYCLAAADDEKLLSALTLHDRALRGALDDLEPATLPVIDLWLLARYFYRQGDLRLADRMLNLLLNKNDLADEQRRSGQRLRAVVLSKI